MKLAGSVAALSRELGYDRAGTERIRRAYKNADASIAHEIVIDVERWLAEHSDGAPGEPPHSPTASAGRGRESGDPVELPASEFRGAPGTRNGPPAGYRRIPMVTIEPAASDSGNELEIEIEETEGDTWLPDWFIRAEYGIDPERVRHIRVRGDSMKETILPGQRLVIGLVPYGHVVADGHIYVFRGPGGVLIKRLYVEPDHIHVWSDNEKAPRYRVPLETFSRDYRIAAVALEISSKL